MSDRNRAAGAAPVLRTGIAGFGAAAQVFHLPLLRAVPGFRVDAVSSSRPDAVRSVLSDVRIHADAESLCRDPDLDLIILPTPNQTHAPLAEVALRAGKHVLVDKPFALDAVEAAGLLSLAAAEGRVLSVFQNRRWDGDFLTLQAVIRSGRIGRPVEFQSHFDRFRPGVPQRWRDQAGPGSGIWYDLGPHLADQALQLFGRPKSVFADLAELRDGAETPDYAHAVLYYDRLRVVLHATTLAAALPPRFVLHGTAGSFVIHGLDPQEDALKAGMVPGAPGWGLGAPDGVLTTADGTETVPRLAGDYRHCYQALHDAIRGAGIPPVLPEEALEVMQVLDAGRHSSATGRRIDIMPGPEETDPPNQDVPSNAPTLPRPERLDPPA
jgi:scyllo-inositol 2-dehydrogenase (NADP+)